MNPKERLVRLATGAVALIVSIASAALLFATWVRRDATFLLLGLTTLPLAIGLSALTWTDRDPILSGRGSRPPARG